MRTPDGGEYGLGAVATPGILTQEVYVMSMKFHESAVHLQETSIDNVVVVEVIGKLTKEDYEAFVPLLERAIEEHGRIRLLFLMTDFQGWKPSALWADTMFGAKHFRDIERVAMVGDKAWEHGMAIFCRPFTTGEVRYFDRSDLAAAEAWISE